MIWADRIAIALFALIAVAFGIVFIASDAPQHEAALQAKAEKLAAACAPRPTLAAPSADALGLDDDRLPASVCSDEKLNAEIQAEMARAPTVTGTLIDIAEAGIFFVAPVWVGLRIFDVRTGGPRRRLARSPYWKATHDIRAAARRKRRERWESRS